MARSLSVITVHSSEALIPCRIVNQVLQGGERDPGRGSTGTPSGTPPDPAAQLLGPPVLELVAVVAAVILSGLRSGEWLALEAGEEEESLSYKSSHEVHLG